MKRSEFMSNSTLVGGLREILEGEIFKTAQEILKAEGPLKKRDSNANSDRILGRIEGFDEYESKLADLANYLPQKNVLNDEVVDTDEDENA